MKILKEGKIPEKKIRWYRVKCNHCNTEFAFSENDKDVRILTEKRLNGKSTFSLFCSLCGKNISGDLSDLQFVDLLEGEEPSSVTSWLTAEQERWPNEDTWKYHPESELIYSNVCKNCQLKYSDGCSTCPLNPNVYNHLVDYDKSITTWTNTLDCDNCPNKPDFKNGKIVAGDSPCDWCPKRQVTCTNNVKSL